MVQRNCCMSKYYYLLFISSYRLPLRKLSFDLGIHNLNSLVVSFIHIALHFGNWQRYVVVFGNRDHAYPVILGGKFMIYLKFFLWYNIYNVKFTILTISKCTIQWH